MVYKGNSLKNFIKLFSPIRFINAFFTVSVILIDFSLDFEQLSDNAIHKLINIYLGKS